MRLNEFDYLIDDDFLPDVAVQDIHDTLINSDASYSLGKQLLGGYKFDTDIDPYEGSQFNHMFFIDSKVYSPYWEKVLGILHLFCRKHNVEVHAVMRCKSNLTFPDTHTVPHTETPHVDHRWPHFTLLYYVNDADGDTIIYNEKFDGEKTVALTKAARVSPKAGRAVLFNGLNYHSPSVPQHGYRSVINFTFLGEFYDI